MSAAKEEGSRITPLARLIRPAFKAQFGVLNPIHQRFERLEDDVPEPRRLNERVSRNEGRIQIIRQQVQTADAPPAPPE